jgi:hypothetical protein
MATSLLMLHPTLSKEWISKICNKTICRVTEIFDYTFFSKIWMGEVVEDDAEFKCIYTNGSLLVDINDRPMFLGKNFRVAAMLNGIMCIFMSELDISKRTLIANEYIRTNRKFNFDNITIDSVLNVLNWKKAESFKFEQLVI